jgi:hypothetical protein
MNGGRRAGWNLHPARITALVVLPGEAQDEIAADHPRRVASKISEPGLPVKTTQTGSSPVTPMIPFIPFPPEPSFDRPRRHSIIDDGGS